MYHPPKFRSLPVTLCGAGAVAAAVHFAVTGGPSFLLAAQVSGQPWSGGHGSLMAAEPISAATAPIETTRVSRELANLQDNRLDESSGLAASRRYADCYWTHNDSGDVARAFLVDRAGKTRLLINLRGADAQDWEDCAAATVGGRSELYLADSGDNLKRRPNITIYRVHETDVPAIDIKAPAPEAAPEAEVPCGALVLTYPDGAHDAETLIAAADGRLLIVTKSSEGSGLYVTPEPFGAGGAQTLKKIGFLQFRSESFFSRLATGGDLAADGSRLVIRTYTHAYEWEMKGDAIDGAWWQRAPRKFVLTPRRQGESIAYALDSRTLLATSEKIPAPLDEIEPEGVGQAAPQ